MNSIYFSFKRIFDLLFSLIALLLLSPLFFFIGFGIKISSSGPIFFNSKRIGEMEKQSPV